MTDTATGERDEADALRAEIARLESVLLLVNDALFGLAGIFGRAMVDTNVIGRADLADAIEHRAGGLDEPDHNPALLAFARAVRMNFPGGAFEVIEGGKPSEVDPV